MSLIKKGNLAPRDAAEGSEIIEGVEGNSGTLIRRGDYDALVAARHAFGGEAEADPFAVDQPAAFSAARLKKNADARPCLLR